MNNFHYLGLACLFALLMSCGDDGSLVRNEQSSGPTQSQQEPVPPQKCEVYQSRDRVVIQCPELVKMCRAVNNKLICEDLTPQ